jgi:hypothetical protein
MATDRGNKLTQEQFTGTYREMRQRLEDQPKRSIFLQQPFGTDPTKVKAQLLQVNAVIYQVPYGKFGMVPESIYHQAVNAGMAPPQTEEDMVYMDRGDRSSSVSDYIIVNGSSIAAERNASLGL